MVVSPLTVRGSGRCMVAPECEEAGYALQLCEYKCSTTRQCAGLFVITCDRCTAAGARSVVMSDVTPPPSTLRCSIDLSSFETRLSCRSVAKSA